MTTNPADGVATPTWVPGIEVSLDEQGLTAAVALGHLIGERDVPTDLILKVLQRNLRGITRDLELYGADFEYTPRFVRDGSPIWVVASAPLPSSRPLTERKRQALAERLMRDVSIAASLLLAWFTVCGPQHGLRLRPTSASLYRLTSPKEV